MEAAREPPPLRLETVSQCPICGGGGEQAYQDLPDRHWQVPGGWSFLRCAEEGVLWLSPRPVPEDLHFCYPATYFTHDPCASAPYTASERRKDLVRRWVLAGAYGYTHLQKSGPLAAAAARLLTLMPPIHRLATHKMGACMVTFRPNGRLLDVGCGNGEYLLRMRGYGWQVAGIEPDPTAARVAREKYGLEVFPGLVEDAPLPEGSFDVITARHVIEHIASPRPFLESLTRLLKPGGQLILLTPNAASLGHRLFRRDYYSLDPPRHLVLYTPTGIDRLLRQTSGLRVLSLRTPPRIARKIARHAQLVRRHGSFRVSDPGATPAEKLAARLFHTTEAAATILQPVGEEIELVSVRE